MSDSNFAITPNKKFSTPSFHLTSPKSNPNDQIADSYAFDFNGDGFDDLFSLQMSFPLEDRKIPMRIYLNDKNGSFTESTQEAIEGDLPTTIHPRDITFADFNADGITDLFIADHGFDQHPFPGHTNSLILSNSNGKLFDASSRLPSTADFTHSTTSADIDGDGDIDIYVGNINLSSPPAYFLINDGTGNFSQKSLGYINSTMSDLVDTDNDGDPDLVLTSYNGSHSVILKNDGSGNFDQQQSLPDLPQWYAGNYQEDIIGPIGVISKHADINGDGRVDLLLNHQNPHGQGSYLQILVQQENGEFLDESNHRISNQPSVADAFAQPIATQDNLKNWMVNLHTVDIDKNGSLDLVAQYDQQAFPSIYLNDGNGFFKFHNEYGYRANDGDPLTVENYQGSYGRWTLLDINNDGKLDIANVDDFQIANQLNEFPDTAEPTTPQSFKASSASELFSGGNAIDTIEYANKSTDYKVLKSGDNATIQRKSNLSDTDEGVSLERLSFSDTNLALDINGPQSAGGAYRLYQAAFDRTPDTAGLGYWIDAVDKGMSLESVANSFLQSQEFKSLYGDSPSNQQFVTLLYNNVLNREPDADGLDYWLNDLSSGISRAGVLASFSESQENQLNVIGQIENGLQYLLWEG